MVKGQRDRIDTVALVGRRREAFTVEYMAKVALAVLAGDLGAPLFR